MRSIHWIILLCVFVGTACKAPEDKIKKSEIIPREELIPILVEMHLTDGLQLIPGIRAKYPGRDSISNYQDVLMFHGFNKVSFDRTIKFYEDDPEKLDDLYEEVISELTKLQSEIQQSTREMVPEDMMTDLWSQKSVWHLPDDGRINPIEFKIPVPGPGKYMLNTTIRMHQDDQSIEPRVTAFFWFDDGSETGFRIPFDSSPINKNGKIGVHSLSLNLENNRVTHLSGFLLDHNPQIGNWEKHADVLNVKVQYIHTKTPPGAQRLE
jgi:hypothetical protein